MTEKGQILQQGQILKQKREQEQKQGLKVRTHFHSPVRRLRPDNCCFRHTPCHLQRMFSHLSIVENLARTPSL